MRYTMTAERGRAARQPLRLAAMAIATITLLAGVAVSPAGARPPEDRPGKGNRDERSTTTTTTTTTSTTTTTTPSPAPLPDPSEILPSTSEEVDDGSLRRAALRITVQTTSDWVQVEVPGASAGHVVRDVQGDREVLPSSRGVVVRGAAGSYGAATVEVVTEVPWSFDSGWVTVQQGGIGSTFTAIENVTATDHPVAAVVTNPTTTRTSTPVTADLLMGTQQLEWVRADDERRVFAFTYPWFGDGATTDPDLAVHPTDPWNSERGDEALRMAQVARDHGIDGFVMSFSGGARHGLPLYHSLRAAEATGGTASVLVETTEAGSAAVVEEWITEALKQSGSPAFLRLDGVPVIFAFASGWMAPGDWRGISERLAAAGTPVHIVADTWEGQDGPIAGQYRYNALLESPTDEMTEDELRSWNQAVSRGLRARATLGAGEPGLVVATVQPGWDDRRIRGWDRLVVPWDGTQTYDRTWRAAIAGEADWVVVTSWNEWFEGTGVAPSVEHGDAALQATAAWAQRFGS